MILVAFLLIFYPYCREAWFNPEISDFVFRMAVKAKQKPCLSEEFDIFISINVSSQDLLSESFQEKVFQMIDESKYKTWYNNDGVNRKAERWK